MEPLLEKLSSQFCINESCDVTSNGIGARLSSCPCDATRHFAPLAAFFALSFFHRSDPESSHSCTILLRAGKRFPYPRKPVFFGTRQSILKREIPLSLQVNRFISSDFRLKKFVWSRRPGTGTLIENFTLPGLIASIAASRSSGYDSSSHDREDWIRTTEPCASRLLASVGRGSTRLLKKKGLSWTSYTAPDSNPL
ncbi:hypothetical protein KSP40_PGU000501 [Platanthera guangdongensis]|uniref:Maturase K n=1 Tax=Platanthera guangdongensis TaxID=2320717 RepID=A0ABR2M884_9ASPA